MPASDDIQLYGGMASGLLPVGAAPMLVLPAIDGPRAVRCVTLQAYGVSYSARFALCFRGPDGMDHPVASVGVIGNAYPPMFHPDWFWSVEPSEVWARWDGSGPGGTGRFRFLYQPTVVI